MLPLSRIRKRNHSPKSEEISMVSSDEIYFQAMFTYTKQVLFPKSLASEVDSYDLVLAFCLRAYQVLMDTKVGWGRYFSNLDKERDLCLVSQFEE